MHSSLDEHLYEINYTCNTSLFDEFVCKLGLFWHAWANSDSVEQKIILFHTVD
jgi:hypothetical protein